MLLSPNCQPRLAPYEDFLLFTLMSSSFAAIITTITATQGGPIDVSDPLTVVSAIATEEKKKIYIYTSDLFTTILIINVSMLTRYILNIILARHQHVSIVIARILASRSHRNASCNFFFKDLASLNLIKVYSVLL